MRTAGLALVVLFIAPHVAGKIVRFSPEEITVHVGETIDTKVVALQSGFNTMPGSYDWQFTSADSRIATAEGRLRSPRETAFVRIHGIAEGRVAIVYTSNHLPAPARIRVICGQEVPVAASTPTVTARVGQQVSLRVVSSAEERTLFEWFLGKTGDRSIPIPASGSECQFTPSAPGTQSIWVSAITACSISAAEFRVEVASPKRRSARH
jgi:hypothetical protein